MNEFRQVVSLIHTRVHVVDLVVVEQARKAASVSSVAHNDRSVSHVKTTSG